MSAQTVIAAPIRRTPPHGLGWLLVCAALTTACATHKPTTVADHFIRKGKPTIDFGGPTKSSTSDYIAQMRKLAAEAHPRQKSLTPPVAESNDPRLHDALMRLKVTPTAEVHRDVAVEYRRLGISDAAYSHLSAAIALAPKDAAAYDQRARVWRAWQLPELGLPDARKAVALAPSSASAWNTLGLLLEESGEGAGGIRAYLRAVVLDDTAAYAWSNLCRTWVRRQDGASAIQACRRAATQLPADRIVAMNLVTAERLIGPSAAAPRAETQSVSGDRVVSPGVTRRFEPVHY